MTLSKMAARNQRGITLLELMIVVAVIGILAAIGYPSYRDQVRRSNRAEAKSALMNAAALQEKFFSNRNTYTENMADLGLVGTEPYRTEKGYYTVDAAAATTACPIATCYLLEANVVTTGGQKDDTRCAKLTLSSTGVKGGTNTDCW